MTTLVNWQKKALPRALLVALGLISPATHALSPPNIQTNIPWSSNFTGVSAIMAAYNNARRQEEIQLGLPVNKLGNLVLPAQATWDGMSDDAKALFIINAERTARAGMMAGVIGLPLAGVESHVDNVSKAYAQLLHDTDKTGHYQPSGNSTTDNPQKRLSAGVGSTCMEFMTRSENLAYFSMSSTQPVSAASIPSPLERAIYAWIYDDSGSAWGHREAVFLQDTPLSYPTQTWGYKNNNGSSAHEGFLGFHVIGSTGYTPFGTPTYPYSYGVAVVMNVIDPVSDAAAANCAYSVTTRMEDLPSTNPVNQVPKAVNDTATTTTGKAVTISNVLANDSDPDGDTLTITANTNPTNGTVTRNGADFTYTPKSGFTGMDTFTYTVSDGKGGTATGTVTVTVNAAPNQPPKAVNDTAITTVGKVVTISNVLANDSDPDGDTLSVTANTNPTNGTVTRNGANFTYTPNASFTGADTFTYTISDGKGGTAVGTVTVTVNAAPNQAPKAVNDTATVNAGETVAIDVLANDSDPDGNSLSITNNTKPSNGTVTLDGKFYYTPKAGFVGTDSFTYTIGDGKGGTATGTVTITVKSTVNQPPKAVNDSVNTAYDTNVTIDVLSNDSDPEGDAITLKSFTQASNGRVQKSGTGFIYNPNAGFGGTDSFTYTIVDSKKNTATATVTITVKGNAKPVAGNDTVSTGYAQPVTINVLSNDSDADQDPLTIKSNTAPSKGKVKLAGNSFIYTPNKNASGVDTFTYTISDGKDGTATGTVTINIAANKNPIAVNDSASGYWHKTIPITIDVLANDSDSEGQPLSITSFTQPAYGKVTKQGTTLVYKNPAISHYGKDSFQYTISDGNGGTATATVNLTISSPL